VLSWAVFYIILFSCLAVLLVAAGITAVSRQRRRLADEENQESAKAQASRRTSKARRAQSKQDRRKRH
jgi:hypothetical protein